MKKAKINSLTLAIAALCAGGPVHATKPYEEPKPVGDVIATAAGGHSRSDSRAAAASEAEANSEAFATSESQSQSTSSGEANSNSGGNVLNSSVVHRGVRNAPGAFAAAGDTTAICQGDRRVGLSIVGGGLSLGKSYTVKDCLLAHSAAEEAARGNLVASIKLRCRISVYKEALGEDCEALLNTQDGSGRTRGEADPVRVGGTQDLQTPAERQAKRKADREKLLQEVSK